MPVDVSYKSCLCVKKMNEANRSKFDGLVAVYGDALNQGNKINSILYTLHDFDHHCINIFYIISTVILDETYLESQNGLTDDELFILNLSVLFHDISMAKDIHCDRKLHSYQSANFIRNEFEDHSSVLYKTIHNNNIINALAQIVQAHSDVKDGKIQDSQNGIYNPDLKDKMPVQIGEVRAKLLAGILRLADELDVTCNRIGDESFADQLNSDDPDEAESKHHWNKLHYFSAVQRGRLNGEINLVVDDAYSKKKIEEGNLKNVVDIIHEVESKVLKEFLEIDKVIFKTTPNANHIVTIQSIAATSNLTDLMNELKELRTRTNIQASSIPILQIDNKENNSHEQERKENPKLPEIINIEFEKEINSIIENRNLISSGHFLLNRSFCARDWIDTKEILETEDIFEKCVQIICNHIKEKFVLGEKRIIVGLDFGGTLIASRVAFALKMPFTFILPVQPIDKDVSHDKEVNLADYDKVILIADVIATFETVESAINDYQIIDKIEAIYTLLYRKPIDESNRDNSKLLTNLYSLNNNYQIEVFKKEKCSRFPEKCFAKNKPANC